METSWTTRSSGLNSPVDKVLSELSMLLGGGTGLGEGRDDELVQFDK